jgi:hypothetical protein
MPAVRRARQVDLGEVALRRLAVVERRRAPDLRTCKRAGINGQLSDHALVRVDVPVFPHLASDHTDHDARDDDARNAEDDGRCAQFSSQA